MLNAFDTRSEEHWIGAPGFNVVRAGRELGSSRVGPAGETAVLAAAVQPSSPRHHSSVNDLTLADNAENTSPWLDVMAASSESPSPATCAPCVLVIWSVFIE